MLVVSLGSVRRGRDMCKQCTTRSAAVYQQHEIVQECRSAGVQECRRAGVQECRSAGVQKCSVCKRCCAAWEAPQIAEFLIFVCGKDMELLYIAREPSNSVQCLPYRGGSSTKMGEGLAFRTQKHLIGFVLIGPPCWFLGL
jgi:hypothetical protein